MTRRHLLKAWARRHPLLVGFFVVGTILAVIVGSSLEAVTSSEHRADAHQAILNHRFVNYQVDNKVVGCRSSNNSRLQVQLILDRAARGSVLPPFDQVTGFDRLAPDYQSYLLNLQAALQRPGPGPNLADQAADYRHNNPHNVNCGQVGRRLRARLEGSPP